jgi:plastocyanin
VRMSRAMVVGGAAAVAALGAGNAAAASTAGSRAAPVRAQAVPDRGFLPGRVVVLPGARVFFRNADRLPHTATAVTLIRGRPAFSSGPATRGAFSVIAPRRPGTYRYICAIHGFMQGTLVVRPRR